MNALEKCKKTLDTKGITYEILSHDTPSGDLDEIISKLGIKYSDGISNLFIKGDDNKYYTLLRRDDRQINNKKLEKALGIKSFTLCTPSELARIGIGKYHDTAILIPETSAKLERVLVDKAIDNMTICYTGLGSPETTIKIAKDDLLSLIGKFEFADITDENLQRADEVKKGSFERILSGITPSSSMGLHLANYLGAVKPHVELQDKGECFYFIADYHALNTVYDAKQFNENTYITYLDYLALGIDTDKTHFYVQSYIPEIFELMVILTNTTTIAEAQRMHAYKDKLQNPNQDPGSINMGLFNYPILMAADILIFTANLVPVGEDQSQHVEMCRQIARSFNKRYENVLTVPELFTIREVARIVGTDGERKMSKSLDNFISIFADEQIVKKQIMKTTTDPNRIHPGDSGNPEKNPLFSYMRHMEYKKSDLEELKDRYRKGTVGDVEIKELFYNFFMKYFDEARKRRAALASDRSAIIKLMEKNAKEITPLAQKTIRSVRNAIGSIRAH